MLGQQEVVLVQQEVVLVQQEMAGNGSEVACLQMLCCDALDAKEQHHTFAMNTLNGT